MPSASARRLLRRRGPLAAVRLYVPQQVQQDSHLVRLGLRRKRLYITTTQQKATVK